MLDKLLFLVALAGTAVVFADVLVRPGMLLEPVQRWVRTVYMKLWLRRYLDANGMVPQQAIAKFFDTESELDKRWWWSPLWGCYKCVAGQWGFWGYLIRYHGHYNFFEHLAFTAFTILAAIILHRWSQD